MPASRGLRNSVTRLMVLPFPAASRPSNRIATRAPDARTHSCIATSSVCRRRNSVS